MQALTQGGAPESPAWSPDGSKVVFWDFDSHEIAYVPADGSATATPVASASSAGFGNEPMADWQPVR